MEEFKGTTAHRRKAKFAKEDEKFFAYLEGLERDNVPTRELLSQFALYVGEVNLARFLTFYETYKKVVNVSGHIADVGTWKGNSLLALVKLASLLEPHSNTEAYGFDWFKGTESLSATGDTERKYEGDKARLMSYVEAQGYEDRTNVVDIDLTKQLQQWLDERPWLRFKYVFMDCGVKEVLDSSLGLFWNRLSAGGILVLDHYNHENSPYESASAGAVIGERPVQQVQFSRSPTGFVVK